jgi:hypothetical protein
VDQKQKNRVTDISAAKALLTRLIEAPEKTHVNDPRFDLSEIRKAARFVGDDILNSRAPKRKTHPDKPNVYEFSKSTSKGTLIFIITFDEYISLELRDMKNDQKILHNTFSLVEPVISSFTDSRWGILQMARLTDIERNSIYGNYPYLIRGSRWMFANLLSWDIDNIIMPEQLDVA